MRSPLSNGFSLVELILTIGVMSVLTLSLLVTMNVVFRTIEEKRFRVGAVALAHESMEYVRNLPYDDVGVSGQIPDGILGASTVLVRNGVSYTRVYRVFYVDDSYDGVQDGTSDDIVPTDYKQVKVLVSWGAPYASDPVVFVTNVAPDGVETTVGGGTFSLTVFDMDGTPVPQAIVDIHNTALVPEIHYDDVLTNNSGRLIVPGMPESVSSYELTVTKSCNFPCKGYSVAQTYSVDPANNPNPNPGHLSVFEGNVTSAAFQIDEMSSVTILTKDATTQTPLSLPFRLRGTKTIGEDDNVPAQPIYKYDEVLQTDASGALTIPLIEWDQGGYDVVLDNGATGKDIAGSSPPEPFSILPGVVFSLDLRLADHAAYTLLVTVRDTSQNLQSGGVVRLYDGGVYDETVVADNQGQAFFSERSPSSVSPLAAQTYIADVTQAGFTPLTTQVQVTGNTEVTFVISPLP